MSKKTPILSGLEGTPSMPAQTIPLAQADEFSEEIYLRLNPDVLMAVAAGKFRNGREHYESFGRAEGRPARAPASLPRDRVVVLADFDKVSDRTRSPVGAIDEIRISGNGGIYIIGWVNDVQDRLDSIDLYFPGWSVSFSAASLARVHRPDAESSIGLAHLNHCGFWGFLYATRRLPVGMCSAVLRMKSGAELQLMVHAELVEDHELRNIALTQLAWAKYLGNPYFCAIASIDAAIGTQLVDFNKSLTRKALLAPYVERFGQDGKTYKASIIVCLYGKPEYLFLQQAAFSCLPGIRDYEFVYICNSPEIGEVLLKEARRCKLIYGLDISVIILSANAGFAAANNFAVQYAQSRRILIMNPDVFPYSNNWIDRHEAILESCSIEQTSLFGVPLYYENGSMMHAGMYFENDTYPGMGVGSKQAVSVLRVEHYAKGAPPDTRQFLCSRPVPAVTGAFVSVERSWFERLNGFSDDYIFGHYEDADLCLRSLEAGRAAWVHNAGLYHLEGKGGVRQPPQEGGAIVNRWLFTHNWYDLIVNGLLGPDFVFQDAQKEVSA